MWCRHCGLQPATTAGRAETRSAGLLLLNSAGGQKTLEPFYSDLWRMQYTLFLAFQRRWYTP